MIHEHQGLLRSTGHWLDDDNLSLPLGIKKIPVGFEFLRVHQIGVVMKVVKRRGAEGKDIPILVVSVGIFALPPLRLVRYFREDKRRLERVEQPGFQQPGLGGAHPADENIGKIFSGAPLREDSRDPIRSPDAHFDQLDVRKFFLKLLENLFLTGKGIEHDSPFLLRRPENLLPFAIGGREDWKGENEKQKIGQDAYE